MNKPKIKICVPCPNQWAITPETRRSLDALLAVNDLDIDIMEVRGASIPIQRNHGVNGRKSNAIKQTGFDFDYYLSVDADIAFTVDDLRRLIAHDKDIVGAAYIQRGMDNAYVAGDCRDGMINLLLANAAGVKKVDWVGAGFTLVKRHVFEAMPYPWYKDAIVDYVDESGAPCALFTCEDVGFCLAAAAAGFDTYVDCDCVVEHIININPKQRSTGMEQEKTLTDELNRLAAEHKRLLAESERLKKQSDENAVAQIKTVGAYEAIHKLLGGAGNTAQEAQAGVPESSEPLAAPPELADTANAAPRNSRGKPKRK